MQVTALKRPDTQASSRLPSRSALRRVAMASVRVRQRKDGSTYTAVLPLHQILSDGFGEPVAQGVVTYVPLFPQA
jgi:hypothetical protein